jgi:hypothetical protein
MSDEVVVVEQAAAAAPAVQNDGDEMYRAHLQQQEDHQTKLFSLCTTVALGFAEIGWLYYEFEPGRAEGKYALQSLATGTVICLQVARAGSRVALRSTLCVTVTWIARGTRKSVCSQIQESSVSARFKPAPDAAEKVPAGSDVLHHRKLVHCLIEAPLRSVDVAIASEEEKRDLLLAANVERLRKMFGAVPLLDEVALAAVRGLAKIVDADVSDNRQSAEDRLGSALQAAPTAEGDRLGQEVNRWTLGL